MINKKELNEGGYQVLKNEALILREMDHPNIVKFNDVIFSHFKLSKNRYTRPQISSSLRWNTYHLALLSN